MWRRKRALTGLDDDIRDHLAREIEDNIARGMTPEEARRQALVKFGNVGLAKEDTRAVWASAVLDSLRADLRDAFRGLRKHQTYTLTAIATLAVALGLTSSLFTVYNSLFLRPWPVPEPDRVFALTLIAPPGIPDNGMEGVSPSFAEYELLSARSVRSDLVASLTVGLRMRTSAGARFDRVPGLVVSPRYFDVLQVPLQRGSGFSGLRGQTMPVAVISDQFWRREWGADPGVVGQVVFVNDVATTVVGITPATFRGTETRAADVYLPFANAADWAQTIRAWWGSGAATSPDVVQVDIAGRLRDGWSREEARTELDALHRQLAGALASGQTPEWFRSLSRREVVLVGTAPGQRPGSLRGNIREVFGLLFGACGLVLVLACANVGNLQLARNLARSREIATRLALGASRARILRQLLTEGLLLAALACAGGIAAAWWLPTVVLSLGGAGTDEFSWQLTPDANVLIFAVLLCVTSTIGFGLAPALRATRSHRGAMSMLSGRTTRTRSGPIRTVVLGMQVAISTVLMVAAMLLTRGVFAVSDGLGFVVNDVSAGRVTFATDTDANARRVALARIGEALASAGLAHVAYVQPQLPLEGPGRLRDLGLPSGGPFVPEAVVMQTVSPNYFETLGMFLVAGRAINEQAGSREAIINESALRLLPPGAGPGTEIIVNKEALLVVGVVRDANLVSVTRLYPIVFRSSVGEPLTGILVRDPRPDANEVAAARVRAADAAARVTMISIDRRIATETRNTRFAASVAGGIAGLALALAAVGVLGVFGYMVEERRREIGIRLALGARRSQVVLSALRTMRLATALGLVTGLGLAILAGRLLRSYLYGLSPFDPVSYLAVVAILAISAILATIVPARRAAQVDPAITLRAE